MAAAKMALTAMITTNIVGVLRIMDAFGNYDHSCARDAIWRQVSSLWQAEMARSRCEERRVTGLQNPQLSPQEPAIRDRLLTLHYRNTICSVPVSGVTGNR